MQIGGLTVKVKLPSDNMTQAQLKRQNGPVEAYNLGGPMNWQEMLALPYDLRKQYLEKLRDEYKATQVMLAKMLGVSLTTLRRRCSQWDIDFPRTGGHMSEETKLRWLNFLQGMEAPTETTPAPAEPAVPAPAAAPGLAPANGSMTFHGHAGAALLKAYELLGETDCTLTITWETEE